MGNAEGKVAVQGGVKLVRRARIGQGFVVEEISSGGGGLVHTAGDVCKQNPGHFVCHADQLSLLEESQGTCHSTNVSWESGPRRMGADEELLAGRVYAVLPCDLKQLLQEPGEISALLAVAALAKQRATAAHPSDGESEFPAADSHRLPLLSDDDPLQNLCASPLSPKDVSLLLAQDLGGTPPSPDLVDCVLADARLEMEDYCCISPRSRPSVGNNNVTSTVITPELMRRDPDLQSAVTKHIVSRSCSRHWRLPLDTIQESPSSSSTST